MGLLVEGKWVDKWYDTQSTGGRFVRTVTRFRNWITPDGAPGPTGEGGFPAEAGRYHLYVSYACPWAHRTLIFRQLKKLADIVSVSVIDPFMGAEGWVFADHAARRTEGATSDSVLGMKRLYEVYLTADPAYSGRVTVPVLWDRRRATIVSNESAEIIRMFNSGFGAFTDDRHDYYPPALAAEIDALNARIYDTVNNGVYKAGFATSQEAYEEAVAALFAMLDELEARLAGRSWLMGETLTEVDVRLFTTLIRFDAVYVGHFKCNIRRIADYPNLSRFLKALYHLPGVAQTVNLTHIKRHYYESHKTINPTGIVPVGPELEWI
ncbi:glutathione S-transferase family protein [Starkeya sp. 3C]|uniref:Glutathione S-transferase family protein n=1 Tax=Ancylobacter moscoviensis TaxID=2597768 RepID=A0ABY3DRQ1_9HYPH|nr:glutathione S-transferase family protein [Ancylobacter moscoviensis]TSJ62737.1 glutathione S-transferase family protein [Ancylobacter moscoviensis]